MDVVAASAGGGQYVGAVQWDYTAAQVIAVGASAASSAANANASVLCLVSTTNCWYRIGGTAAAHTAPSVYLPANQIFMLKNVPSAVISVIQDAAAGYLSILPARQTPL